MEETRVSRYKEYRQSFIKEGSISGGEEMGIVIDHKVTTSTLPMNEVLSAVQLEEKKDNSFKKRKIIKMIIYISLGVLAVSGLIVLGIFAWGNI